MPAEFFFFLVRKQKLFKKNHLPPLQNEIKPIKITCFPSSVSGSCPQLLSGMIFLVPLSCAFLGETSEKYFLALLSSSETSPGS